MITIVPFPTALVAEYFRTPEGTTAAAIYSGHSFNIAIAFNLLWRYAAGREGHLLGRDVDLAVVKGITKQYRFGPLLYGISFGLAFVSVTASLAVNAGLAVFFALPPPDMRKKVSEATAPR